MITYILEFKITMPLPYSIYFCMIIYILELKILIFRLQATFDLVEILI